MWNQRIGAQLKASQIRDSHSGDVMPYSPVELTNVFKKRTASIFRVKE
jgi:hypothetical protein